MANGTFKMKMDIDRRGLRLMPNNCKNLNPPFFSLPTTFKRMILYVQVLWLYLTVPFHCIGNDSANYFLDSFRKSSPVIVPYPSLSNIRKAHRVGRVHSHDPSIRSLRGTKVVRPDFQPMRVPEEPFCIDLFRQNLVFTSQHLKSPVHVVQPLSAKLILQDDFPETRKITESGFDWTKSS